MKNISLKSILADFGDNQEVETELDGFFHHIAYHNLTGNEYAKLCALANSDSDLSEADNAEYIALEKKAKEPIIYALDNFSFTDFFIELMNGRIQNDSFDMNAMVENNSSLYINIVFITFPFEDEMLKAVLQNELTGNQMAIVERFMQCMDTYEENSTISDIVESSEFSNDEKMHKILEAFSDDKRKIVERFKELWCDKAIKIIKDFVNKPLRELYRQ